MILRRDIYQALADPTRRAILTLLASQTITAGAIATHFNAARSTVSKHIQILTECGLVHPLPQGREIYYEIVIDGMAEVHRYVAELRAAWENRFDNLDMYVANLQKQKHNGKQERS